MTEQSLQAQLNWLHGQVRFTMQHTQFKITAHRPCMHVTSSRFFCLRSVSDRHKLFIAQVHVWGTFEKYRELVLLPGLHPAFCCSQ